MLGGLFCCLFLDLISDDVPNAGSQRESLGCGSMVITRVSPLILFVLGKTQHWVGYFDLGNFYFADYIL